MKYIIIPAAVLLLMTICFYMFTKSKNSNTPAITSGEFAKYFDILKNSRNDDAYIVIAIENSEDFIQFTNSSEGFEIDIPLITERQKSLESKIIEVYKKNNLTYRYNYSTNHKNRFIDLYVKLPSNEIGNLVTRLFNEIFNTSVETKYYIKLGNI